MTMTEGMVEDFFGSWCPANLEDTSDATILMKIGE